MENGITVRTVSFSVNDKILTFEMKVRVELRIVSTYKKKNWVSYWCYLVGHFLRNIGSINCHPDVGSFLRTFKYCPNNSIHL